MRYAELETKGVSAAASVHDVSETGLSFTVSFEHDVPEEGDVLKLEFALPRTPEIRNRNPANPVRPNRRSRANQIACFATVIRTELRSEWDPELGDLNYRLVAVQFRNLPTGHLRILQKGLRGHLKAEESIDWRRLERAQTLLFGLSAAALTALVYVMAQPLDAWLRWFAG